MYSRFSDPISPPVRLASCIALYTLTGSATAAQPEEIELDVRPKICTLSTQDEECKTVVQAQWHASREESLCLLIVGRPEIKRCWENYAAGLYTVELAFSEDLVVELRDPELQRVLVSQAIAVIREALQLRRRRRQPWSIFY